MADKCMNCGKESTGAKFCEHCGAPKTPPPPSPAETPAPAAQPAAPPVSPLPPAPMPRAVGVRKKSTLALIFGVAGAAVSGLAIAGSLLPWVSVSIPLTGVGQNIGGWDKDGKITVFLAAIALVFFVIGALTVYRWPFIVAAVFSVGCLVIFIVDVIDVKNTTIEVLNVHVGYGLWMGLACGALMVVAAAVAIAAPRKL